MPDMLGCFCRQTKPSEGALLLLAQNTTMQTLTDAFPFLRIFARGRQSEGEWARSIRSETPVPHLESHYDWASHLPAGIRSGCMRRFVRGLVRKHRRGATSAGLAWLMSGRGRRGSSTASSVLDLGRRCRLLRLDRRISATRALWCDLSRPAVPNS